MCERIPGQRIEWYWGPIDRQVLAAQSRKSDLLGALHTIGFLAGCGMSATKRPLTLAAYVDGSKT